MSATVYNLNIEQGIPFKQEFLVRNPDKSLKNLTGYTARMQFRTTYSSSTVQLSATTANAKLLIDVPSSIVTIQLTEADTTALSYSKYVYDLEIVDSSNVPTRLVEGTVNINPEVTR